MGGAKKPADYLYFRSDGKPAFGSPDNKSCCNGKVIAEFVCDYTKDFLWVENEYPYKGGEYAISDDELERTCLTYQQLCDYGRQRDLHGIHISELKVYDEPKPLGAFYKECAGLYNTGLCYECEMAVGEECDCATNGRVFLVRPPQSWCYVEELPYA